MSARFLVTALSLSCVALHAVPTRADPLGLYVGAGVGRSDVTLDSFPAEASDPDRFDWHATGWKALIGLRPLPWIGAEIEYDDLGRGSGTVGGPVTATGEAVPASASVHGPAAFGVAYLPLPIPMLDIYGKLGAARLRTSGDTASVGVVGVDTCVVDPGALGCRAFHDERAGTHLAWGGGAQLSVLGFALRAEYERFGAGATRPGMASLALVWRF